ncbi:MAG: hypothetical protein H0Z39_03455 [Peptococcaceae bacterium]|nr:hypothetical protein [Peptococcaceae bacterium]
MITIRDQRGSLTLTLVPIFLMIALMVFFIVIGTAFGARKVAYCTYQWFGEAMDFAAMDANQDGDLSQVALRTPTAQTAFTRVFAEMTGTEYINGSFIPQGQSPYPGPITLDSFEPVQPGDPIPYGTARQPGYVAVITVPVFGDEYPFIGEQYVTVPMRYFAVARSAEGIIDH